ncbi:MAG: alpha/beta fold hydrolase [Myxococcota bacterium]
MSPVPEQRPQVPTLPGVTSRQVPTPRLSTHLLSAGPDDGVPVLFVHGNASSATFWEEAMLALPAGFRGLAPDLRGYGDTEDLRIDATRGVGDWVDDLLALVDALGLGPVHLVGHSLGGAVAFGLVAARPTAFRTVTLVAPGSPYGFGGSRPDGTPCHPDGAGSGAGVVNPEFPKRIAAGDRSEEDPQGSPRVVMNTFYWKPPFRPAREEALLSSVLSEKIGPERYPGDAVASEHWPGSAPGVYGPVNALSPKYAGDLAARFVAASPRPPVLARSLVAGCRRIGAIRPPGRSRARGRRSWASACRRRGTSAPRSARRAHERHRAAGGDGVGERHAVAAVEHAQHARLGVAGRHPQAASDPAAIAEAVPITSRRSSTLAARRAGGPTGRGERRRPRRPGSSDAATNRARCHGPKGVTISALASRCCAAYSSGRPAAPSLTTSAPTTEPADVPTTTRRRWVHTGLHEPGEEAQLPRDACTPPPSSTSPRTVSPPRAGYPGAERGGDAPDLTGDSGSGTTGRRRSACPRSPRCPASPRARSPRPACRPTCSAGPDDGVPVLFVHGNASSATFWEEAMLALPAGFRGLAPDLAATATPRTSHRRDPRRRRLGGRPARTGRRARPRPRPPRRAPLGGAWRSGWSRRNRVPHGDAGGAGLPTASAQPRRHPRHDGAGSGAGVVTEFPKRIAAGDRSEEDLQGSPRRHEHVLLEAAVPPCAGEALLSSVLSEKIGPERPGRRRLRALAGSARRVRARERPVAEVRGRPGRALRGRLASAAGAWIRGDSDQIVADGSLFRLHARPAGPGARLAGPRVPPQPMVSQVRGVLERYAAAGGTSARS